jgi:hypothetical protein
MIVRASLLSWTLAVLWSLPASAQWVGIRTAGLPRLPDGSVDLKAPPPKTPDRIPDLSGIFELDSPKFVGNLAADLRPEDVSMTPAGQAAFDQRKTGIHSREDPPANCLPQGVPRTAAAPAPWRIVQTPGVIFIVYEAFTQWRQIFTDGRPLPVDPNPTWLGYSIGRWEGDTLVVESSGFNGKVWLDQMGHPSTDALHVTERYHRISVGQLDLQITIEDPKAYSKPWTVMEHAHLVPDTELLEFICLENEKDNAHIPGK